MKWDEERRLMTLLCAGCSLTPEASFGLLVCRPGNCEAMLT